MSSIARLTQIISIIVLIVACISSAQATNYDERFFKRIATFPVFLNTDVDEETVAEIVAASEDGRTLIYTDAEFGGVGFVDIRRARNPQPAGFLPLEGEPTSVAVRGKYALVATNTSEDFINTSGKLFVIEINSQSIVETFELSGQPDSVAVSPDKRYAAIVIENERDEDLGEGVPPQAPAGFMVVVDMPSADVDLWSLRTIDFTGIADNFPEDPEPEYVDINRRNIAAVTLQENNHIIFVNLKNGKIVNDFSAGTVNLEGIDTEEEDPALISLTSSLANVPREPDALTYLNGNLIATANEGDLDGGSRGFSIFSRKGFLLYDSANTLEQLAVRHGHYPDNRSGNKGNEPESVEYAIYGNERLLFVGSERSNIVSVYNLDRFRRPKLKQVLPAGVGPEGLLAIPHRDLFVVASEVDDRGDKIRASISIYKRNAKVQRYPTVISEDREDGSPIPWSALSGLVTDPNRQRIMYSVYDSFYQQSRIFVMKKTGPNSNPAVINDEIVLKDSGALSSLNAAIVNPDGTVNLDPEGIAVANGNEGGFWIVSEGSGTVDDEDRPIETNNYVIRVARDGEILEVITLPDRLNELQFRFGLEGIASVVENGSEVLYVAFQRAWQAADDPEEFARIGRYDTDSKEWTFAYYPLTQPTSPNGGWVGLSEISALGGGSFGILERDNQGGPDARIKLITKISVRNVEFKSDSETPNFSVLTPTVVRDLIANGDLTRAGGLVYEKIEGMAVRRNGTAFIVNDNDGVDDNSGETQLIRIRNLFKQPIKNRSITKLDRN